MFINLFTNFVAVLRQKLSPMFTSEKTKAMFQLNEECARELSDAIAEQVEINDTNAAIINIKNFNFRYMVDLITLCVFGVEAQAIRDNTSLFNKIAKRIFAHNFYTISIPYFITSAARRLKKALGVSSTNISTTDFFTRCMQDMINQRKICGLDENNNFLQMMFNLRNVDRKKNQMDPDQKKFGKMCQNYLIFIQE